MNYKIVFFILVCSIIIELNAQELYIPGFIIKNDGDTVTCLLKNNNLVVNAQECTYKTNTNSEEIINKPFDIRAFRYENDRYYLSKRVKINNEYRDVFLQFLVDGKADLYYMKDKEKDHYFLEMNDTIAELVNSEVERYIDGVAYVQQRREYSCTMQTMFADCQEIQSQIQKSKFNHKNLVNIVNNYHNIVCKDEKCIVYKRDNAIKTSIGLIGGLSISTLNIKSKEEYYDYFEDIKFTPKLALESGLQFTFRNIFGLEDNYGFNLLILYRNDHFNSQKISINQNKLFVPVFLSYSINNSMKIKPLVNIGFTNSVDIKSEITDRTLERYISDFTIGAMLGAGAEYKIGNLVFSLNLNTSYKFLGNKTAVESSILNSEIFYYCALFGIRKEIKKDNI